MVHLTQLWLPILLAAVFVFIASSILHMVIPIHKGDFKKMPGEERILAEMRTAGVQPGLYMFPGSESMKDCGSPEFIEKCKKGPVGFVTVIPSGAPGMGKNLLQWFIYCVGISVLVAFLAAHVVSTGAAGKAVFHVTALAAVLGYAMGVFPESIWKGQKWSITLKFVFDGVVYGVVTGATFMWLWPAANPL